ncbi:MAG: DUF3592 domain-containing protein [Magnetococcales bacterium]|nr:DUF3592 domain-containing protein [Magnetococcales bacterium]
MNKIMSVPFEIVVFVWSRAMVLQDSPGVFPVDWHRVVRMRERWLVEVKWFWLWKFLSEQASTLFSPVLFIRSLLLVVGIFFLASGYYPLHLSMMSANWAVVEGEITQSTLLSLTEREGGFMSRLFYRSQVEYEYVIHNQRYRGTQIEFGLGDQRFFLKEFAQRITQRYPVGKPVRVFFNSDQPNEAVLECTPSAGGCLLFMMIGMVCIAVRNFFVKR